MRVTLILQEITARMRHDLLILILALVLTWELYCLVRRRGLRKLLNHRKAATDLTIPRQMKPSSENDCPMCRSGKPAMGSEGQDSHVTPLPWSAMKGRGGSKKRISTQG
jgi:hypothetical protein